MTEPDPTYSPAADTPEAHNTALLALRADLIALTISIERVLEANGRPVRYAVVTRQARRRHLTEQRRMRK